MSKFLVNYYPVYPCEEMQELSDVERSVFVTALTSEFGDKEDKDV